MIPNLKTKKVYYVETNTAKRSFNPIAIAPHSIQNRIEWYDMGRGDFVIFKTFAVSPLEDMIEITTEEGDQVILKLLTLPVYNERIRPWVAHQPIFISENELQNYFLTTNFELYDP
jgi:hypothetical protein